MDHRIASTTHLIVLVYVFLFSIHQILHGVVEARSRIVKGLETTTHYNEMYDCIDFYKQPAFDHPLLANHTFHPEMRPSSTPYLMRRSPNISRVNDVEEVEFEGIGCPVGTVPIRRASEKERIRERLLNVDRPGTHYANVRTKRNPRKKYYGGSAGLSIWNPSVQNSQYSSGQIVIRNGNDNIQVGWTVNPNLYGDHRTRLFIYTGAGPTVQCFNTYCPGFVLVNKDMPVDRLATVSTRGGPTYFIRLVISKDASDGHWWLRRESELTPVGFWPKNIFTDGLSDVATSVEWGGQVSGPPNMPSPPMGSGTKLKGDTRYDAYCKFVSVVNEAHQVVDAVDIETNADSSRYHVVAAGNRGGDFGNIVIYGGPGGAIGN